MRGPYLDTSALAKWYLNEVRSEELEMYLGVQGQALISELTRVEMRCLLARRRRARDFGAEMEARIFGVFQGDVSRGFLQVGPVGADCYQEAVNLISALPDHPLRALDALHLAVAQSYGARELATADRVMLRAAEELGFRVVPFCA
ncbi:MAG: type II toxin-antitoxin system VapC family toxin [Deferrisomatales bacterium]|nr:type II toxin-antitoxin system VapC family toxin [Deferrisomatales bacterium]